MSEEPNKARTDVQAGTPGEAAAVGPEVGGVRSNDELNWLDLWTLSSGERARLKEIARDAACSHARQRSEGAGDGSQEITTPQKLRKLQRALYCKAKAQPGYRFWSLYSELTRRDLLEYAFELVARNGGSPGVDGQTIDSIRATPERRDQWLTALQKELQTHSYRPNPVRRVYIPKSDGGQRPLGIPTVKDRVVQMVALMVLAPIFEADFHPHSYGFRPRRDAHQAIDAIVEALRQGKLEVVDADLSKYFDTIPHDRLVKLIARRTSDGSVLHLLGQWLDAPIVEEQKDGTKRILPNEQGVPQGGVISPLLANVYLNALDWAVNDPRQRGQPVLVRYADDFVILCAPGQSTELMERLRRWLAARGLQLNEQKTRKVNSREGFQFLGFTLRWQRTVLSGRWYAHVEPSPKSQQRFRDVVREHLNHWTERWRIPDVVAGLNRSVRGWSGYFHYGQSPRVFGKLNAWMRNRMRRWLWRKHHCSRTLWTDYPDEVLHGRYGVWTLPTNAQWKQSSRNNRMLAMK